MVNLNTSIIKNAFLGFKNIVSMYLGEIQLYFHPELSYLTFEAAENNCNIIFYCSSDDSSYNKTIEISYDLQDWHTVSSANDSSNSIAILNKGEKLYLRGNNDAYGFLPDGGTIYGGNTFGFSAKCYVYGNIMSLIDSVNFKTLKTLTGNYAFRYLFHDPNNIVNSENFIQHKFKDIVLPATTLTNRCYADLFRGTSVTKIAKLPATVLAESCYASMYMDCHYLTKVQKLPATTAVKYCYSSMFRNCTALETAQSELPAKIYNGTSDQCYQYMFAGCSSLKKIPLLPTIHGAVKCYFHMFENCSSLTTISNTKLSNETYQECYSFMFYNCTSLKEASELPATYGASSCYKSMFEGCTSLIKIPPKILAGDLQQQGGTCNRMFYGCTSLKTANVVIGTWPNDDSYSHMFEQCVSLESISDLGTFNHNGGSFHEMFHGCKKITKAPKFILNCVYQQTPCYGMFYNCTSLSDISEIKLNIKNLTANTNGNTYGSMFYGCTALTHVPKDFLPATTLVKSCYNSMFQGCSSLVDAPDLPALQMAATCYQNMFQQCTSLKKAPNLPATGLSANCYQNMFNGCTCLTEAPKILPATNINASGCYYSMFRQCTTLKNAPILPAKAIGSVSNAYRQMFEGCSNLEYVECYATSGINTNNSTTNWLSAVKSTGNFYKDDNATWPRSISGIPTGWNVNNNNCITFVARKNDCEISLANLSSVQTLEYSYDKTTWNELDTNTIITLSNIDDEAYVRGVLSGNNTTSDYTQFSISGQVACHGNINALWDKDTLSNTLFEYCGYRLFYRCTGLVSAPSLPSTTLSVGAYLEMFSGCSSLYETPALPATTLATNCYYRMFFGCESLIKIPESLPAMSLATGCYRQMFRNCTALKRIPNPKKLLPCLNLSGGSDKQYVYAAMFMGCTSLENAPELPATVGMHHAYEQMFEGCTSLVTPPPAINCSFNYICNRMFAGCTSLKNTPNFPSTIVDNCYLEMFINCTSLETAPELSATTLSPNCYLRMFKGCSKLKTPMKNLPATTTKANCYYEMFTDCTSLETGPEIAAVDANDQSFRLMFAGCIRLKQPPVLHITSMTGTMCFREMFFNCQALQEMPDLPIASLVNGCYSLMFYNCKNLRIAKPLPAQTLTTECYMQMFGNCTNLNHIEIGATDISASNCLSNWVSGVQTVRGTFIKPAALTTIPSGANGIPLNWQYLSQEDTNSHCIKFRSGADGSIVGLEKLSSNQTIYYSKSFEIGTWNTMTTDTMIVLNNNEELYIRGNLSADNTTTNNTQFKMTGIIYAGGDLRYLWNSNKNAALKKYCGWELFLNCSALYSAPYLSATSTSVACYAHMFKGCTNLSVTPLLPATSITNFCYAQMFQGCSSLTIAPDLPATTLALECYKNMFYDCAALTTPPKTIGSGTATGCCSNMFNGCTALTYGPQLLCSNLSSPYGTNQYEYMFANCSALQESPALLSTRVTNNCYYLMFLNCTSLTTAPSLKPANAANAEFSNMFAGCTSLTDISSIKMHTTQTGGFSCDAMFAYCTSLKNVPQDFLPATTLGTYCYRNMFFGCTSLENAPELPATNLTTNCYDSMFYNCSSLIKSPKLPAKTLVQNCYKTMFYGCVLLNHIECLADSGIGTTTVLNWVGNVQTGGGTFIKDENATWPTGINGIPTNWNVVKNDRFVKFKSSGTSTIKISAISTNQIFEYSMHGQTWNRMTTSNTISLSNNQEVYIRGILSENNTNTDFSHFQMTGNIYAYGNCNNLWDYTADNINELALKQYCGYSLFLNCQSLKHAPDLPSKSLAAESYSQMFANTGITYAPELPAISLYAYNYYRMFANCANLVEAPELPAVTYSTYVYNEMFMGCTSLTKTPKMHFAKPTYYCYAGMFRNCTNLTEAMEELPGTMAANLCYQRMFEKTKITKAPKINLVYGAGESCEYMFNGCTQLVEPPEMNIQQFSGIRTCYCMFQDCTSLTKSPYLPATKLGTETYGYMFNRCSNLSEITCLAEDLSGTNCTLGWVTGVASTGTFNKSNKNSSWTTGADGIPTNWTINNIYDD